MPIALRKIEFGHWSRYFPFVGGMGKSTVYSQVIEESQRCQLISGFLTRPLEFGLQIRVAYAGLTLCLLYQQGDLRASGLEILDQHSNKRNSFQKFPGT